MPGQTATVISRTVIVQRPAVTITVSSTEPGRTETVTQATPTVTSPETVPTVDTSVPDVATCTGRGHVGAAHDLARDRAAGALSAQRLPRRP